MTIATAAPRGTTVRDVQRWLSERGRGAYADATPSLERSGISVHEHPRLIAAVVLEDAALRARRVPGVPEASFRAFLDGTQVSRVVAHLDGIPIVHGTAAAVVRERADRRMRTWRQPLVSRRVYAPLEHLPASERRALTDSGFDAADTLEGRRVESLHPFALQDAAVHAVQEDREALELELASAWCADPAGTLLMDGSIAGSDRVARAHCVVGLVKSHRTLYAESDGLRLVLGLPQGHRSSVFRITSPRRTPVASWYLRLRESPGPDPLHGLVRIEAADAFTGGALTARADEVSRWVLAEALPLALPDARWDTMLYGIRDCEEFLRAIQ